MWTVVRTSLFLVAVAVVAARPAAAIDIDHCGVTIPHNRAGVLTQDVFCRYYCESHPAITGCDPDQQETPCPDVTQGEQCLPQSITLSAGARLHLNGHTIHGAHEIGLVGCIEGNKSGRCTVVGPGLLDCSHGEGIGSKRMDVVVRGVTVQSCDVGISSGKSLLVVDDTIASCDMPLLASGRITRRRVKVLP